MWRKGGTTIEDKLLNVKNNWRHLKSAKTECRLVHTRPWDEIKHIYGMWLILVTGLCDTQYVCPVYSIRISVYVRVCEVSWMGCAVCTVYMYVCMEEAGSWTNIPSCLSFLRYVLCKHHGPWYKPLAWDSRLFPSLVFTEYPLQILSAWCQCHVCAAACRDSTHMKVELQVRAQKKYYNLSFYSFRGMS